MAIIALVQQKGGVGKSTITANIAGELVSLGRKVVVLDLDPQKSLALWGKLGSGLLSQIVESVTIQTPQAFKTKLFKVAEESNHVLIDTPPGLPDAGMLAALLSDVVILPVGASPLDLIAVREALELTREARSSRRDGKPLVFFAPSKLKLNTILTRDLLVSLKKLSEPILPPVFDRVPAAECVAKGLTLCEYAPESAARAEFRLLVKALERMIKR